MSHPKPAPVEDPLHHARNMHLLWWLVPLASLALLLSCPPAVFGDRPMDTAQADYQAVKAQLKQLMQKLDESGGLITPASHRKTPTK